MSAGALAVAALTHARLTGPAKDDDERAVRLARRVVVTGGPVHGVAFGVFTAALSVAVSPLTPGPTLGEPPAVAGLRFGDLPRPVAVTGLAAAASGLLGPLYFVWEPAGWFIPGGRFPGLIVCGIAGTRLAGRRSASEGGSS